MLRSAARRRPNFAGRYVLTQVGCGASCIMLAALDAKTGDVVWWPGTWCCWELAVKEPVEFRRDSERLILHGQVDEAGPAGPHYWRLTGGRFVQVKP